MREADTRHIPVMPREVEWAQRRPAPHRTPLPRPGDTVAYRHDEWATPIEASVLWVQPLDDLHDPNVVRWQTDGRGDLVLIEGRPVAALGHDPWPLLRLKTRIGRADLVVETREARLRGSPGWLPMDWATRWRPGPHAEGW